MTNKLANWLKNNASTILTVLGAAEMVATVIFAIKAAPKAKWKLAEAKVDKEKETGSDKLTVIETLKVCGMDYIPTVLAGTSSLICMFSANHISRRNQATLTAAYAVLSNTFDRYKEKANLFGGPGTNKTIEKAIIEEDEDEKENRPPWDVPQLFYIDGYDGFFERTMEQVKEAEYNFNRNFVLKGSMTFNELLDYLDLPPVKNGYKIGWNEYEGYEIYGYQWIDFEHRHYVTDEGLLVCSIDLPFPPHREGFED